ncbi:hypothetical protein [Streptomyces sp. NPDC059209]|uniref:hypothetical protein n=1 Tax=Streptomyces sp. NPDC059209 TaxID=3346769 RepID=UPI00369C2DB2
MGDVGVVGVVAGVGAFAQAGDGGGEGGPVAPDGVVEAQGEIERRVRGGESGDVDAGTREPRAVFDTVVGSGIADEGGDAGGEGGGAQVESGQQMLREAEFVVGPAGSVKARTKGRWAWTAARSPAIACCSASVRAASCAAAARVMSP